MTFTAPAVTKILTTEGYYEAIPVQKFYLNVSRSMESMNLH